MHKDRLAELRQWAEKVALERGVKVNPDERVANAVLMGLIRNEEKYGRRYCPCRVVSGDPGGDAAKVCPCVWMMEDVEEKGRCHCGLFIKG
ncbi:MAG: ferredoxin:thioredoxin reductase [Candidatus Nezhaarchaeota archaeon]|nr:ferredoxin:thioredoxin reductase [Candidatus Nezhaarchaeota archaeon]